MSDTMLLAAFALRMAGTAFIVVAISWLAARLGPTIGGVVVGLPIVLAPGFGFMLFDQEPAFVADAAAGALFSLAATQIFLLTFVALSRNAGPFRSVGASALLWLVLALPLGVMPHDPLVGAALFGAVTLAARRIGRRWITADQPPASRTSWGLLILRGLAAGLLVGGVTAGASTLGPVYSGAIMAFPIGFTVIAISLHRDHGGLFAGQTAYAGLTGLTSLAGFCFGLSVLLPSLGSLTAFGLALALSLVVTLGLTLRAGRSRRQQG